MLDVGCVCVCGCGGGGGGGIVLVSSTCQLYVACLTHMHTCICAGIFHAYS